MLRDQIRTGETGASLVADRTIIVARPLFAVNGDMVCANKIDGRSYGVDIDMAEEGGRSFAEQRENKKYAA